QGRRRQASTVRPARARCPVISTVESGKRQRARLRSQACMRCREDIMSMTTPLRKVRGRPFKPGNSGRPPGSKNKITQIVEQLAAGHAERLFQKVVELAEAGDVACLRMMLDRLWPPRKGQPVNVNMPPINDSQDVPAAIVSI